MHATKLAMSPTKCSRTFRLPTPRICNDAGNVTAAAKKLNFHPKLAIALVAALFLCLKTTVSGRLDREIITSSDDSLNRLAGFTIDRGYDARNRLTTIAVKRGGQTLHSVSYGRDGFGRVDSVSSADGVSASYTYYTGSNQLHTLTRHGVTTTWQRFPDDGALDRITTSAGDGNRTFEHRYVGSRRVVIDSIHDIRKGVVWNYSYQNRQLTGADGGAGRVFDYAYGELGNRTNANANSANEIQVVTRPVDERTFVIAGSAAPAAQVELSFAGADPISVPNLQGNFSFTFTAPHNSGTAPLRIPVLVRGTVPGQGTDGADAIAEELRQLVVLPTFNDSQTDGSGNLGFDGKWHMRWTVRDNLKRMWTQRSVAEATGIYETLVFNYNAEGQRIYKRYRKYEDDDEDGFAEVLLEDRVHRTVYDGMWHPLFEQVEDGQTGQIVRELAYVWGPDLTGTVGGAGGIGGLLAIVDLTNQKTYLPVYDGRGNVVSVVDAASGQTVAEWDYGPFGEMVEEVEHEPGVLEVCQFQYQTKYTDAETGYVYFGHRYLNTVTGRWLSREPLGEAESVNLYAYCHNDPVNKVDYLGLDEIKIVGNDVFYVVEKKAEKGIHTTAASAWIQNLINEENVASHKIGTVVRGKRARVTGVNLLDSFGGGTVGIGELRGAAEVSYVYHDAGGVYDNHQKSGIRGVVWNLRQGRYESRNAVSDYGAGFHDRASNLPIGIANIFIRKNVFNAEWANEARSPGHGLIRLVYGEPYFDINTSNVRENLYAWEANENSLPYANGEQTAKYGEAALIAYGAYRLAFYRPTRAYPQAPVTGSQWYEYFQQTYGNVEWVSKVPGYAGGKTAGVLATGTAAGDVALISGQSGPAAAFGPGMIAGRNGAIMWHVEAHSAAVMHQLNLSEAVLYINRVPCGPLQGWVGGCEYMLPRMLPPGARLRVIGPNGYDRIFTGIQQ